MRYLLHLIVVTIAFALSACTTTPILPVDAAPVTSPNGGQVMTAMGAALTGRDWNNQAPEAKGDSDTNGDGKDD